MPRRAARAAAHVACLALLAAALAFGGCSRPKASDDYAQARSLWTELLKEKLDDAAADPRAERVLALLARVPSDSPDASSAAQLRKEIASARLDVEATRKRRAKQIADAEAALRVPAMPAPITPGLAASAPAPAPEPAAAAQPEKPRTQPEDGMDADSFRKDFARCFEFRSQALVGGLAGGEVWGLKNLGICRDLHPEFQRNSVLLFDKKVSVRPTSELIPKRFRVVQGQLVPADETESKSTGKALAEETPSTP